MNVRIITATVFTTAEIFLLVTNVTVTKVTNWPTTADPVTVRTDFFYTPSKWEPGYPEKASSVW